MVQEWLANGVFLYLMAGVCGAAIVLKLLLANYYERQLRQTMKMDRARKKWLLAMRQEYEDCMDTHGRVNNVDVFVDKYVEGKKFMGIMLSTWDKIGGQAWVLCAGLLVVAAVSGIFYQVDREAILFTFFIGIWTVIVDIVVDNIANLAEKRKQLKRNLVDYFDNHAWDGMEEDQEGAEVADDFWENAVFSREEAESFRQEQAFSRENGEAAKNREMAADGDPAKTVRLHSLAGEEATGQGVDFTKGRRQEEGGEMPGAEQSPKFYVVGGKEQKAGKEEGQLRKTPFETAAYGPEGQAGEEDVPAASAKKVRRESKKEMAARKKREHMKYELKREITQEEESLPEAQAVQPERKAPSREAMEQLAAAIDLLKKENALEDAAPLLAAQIGQDQENGALIEEVLREFLV